MQRDQYKQNIKLDYSERKCFQTIKWILNMSDWT